MKKGLFKQSPFSLYFCEFCFILNFFCIEIIIKSEGAKWRLLSPNSEIKK